MAKVQKFQLSTILTIFQIKQARDAGALDFRIDIKLTSTQCGVSRQREYQNYKQMIQRILPKYRGAILETNMFLPEIDFVLYLWKKGIFL